MLTHKINDLKSASIDRIDPHGFYEPGNVQLVCKAINLAKSHHTQEEIIDFIQEVRLSRS
jgi:hypothetical protein